MNPYSYNLRVLLDALTQLDGSDDYDRLASTALGLLQQLVRENRVNVTEFPDLRARQLKDFEKHVEHADEPRYHTLPDGSHD